MANQSYAGRPGEQGGRQGKQGERQRSWSGPERRVGINYNYTGPERRRSEFEERQERVPQGAHGESTETGAVLTAGMRRRGSGGTADSGQAGPHRPHDEDVND
ncbi:MAG: hypothetical protein ACYC6J_07705 [Coriobacteriia bacterium]